MQVSQLSFTKPFDTVHRLKPRSHDWGVFGKFANNCELYKRTSEQL